MEFALAVIIRGGVGFIFGLLVGIVGLLASFWVYPGPPPAWVLIIGSGIGAGAAGFISFYKPEASRSIVYITVLVAFIASFIGAVLGFFYGQVAYPEGVRNIYFLSAGSLRSPPVFAIVTGATISTTAFGALYYAFRLFRYHEV